MLGKLSGNKINNLNEGLASIIHSKVYFRFKAKRSGEAVKMFLVEYQISLLV